MKIGVWIIIVLFVIGIAGLIYYKSSSNASSVKSGQTLNPGEMQITIQNFAFSPSSLTINKGDTVVWTNMDSASHTITSDSGNELNSNSLSNGETYSHTFNTAGTFAYHCSIHPGMKATIIVN